MIIRSQESGVRSQNKDKKCWPSAFCLVFSAFCLLSSAVFAQVPQEEYKRIQKDIHTQKKKLESAKKVEKSVLDDLRKINVELNEIERDLKAQRGKIKKIQDAIASVQSDINSNKEGLKTQGSLLKKRLRVLQRVSKENDALLVIISGEDMAQALRMLRYISDISAHDYKIINRYKETVKILSEKQKALEKLFAELKTEEVKLARLEASLKDKQKERETLLVSVRKEKRSYEKMISDLKEASGRLLRIIQESEKRESEHRKKKSPRTRPGTKEEEPVEDSGFARLKGRLQWPVHGKVAMQYGTQVDPLFNLPVFRSGIHIKTGGSSTARAVYEGKVVFADEFKGYGQLVILSHGGGYHTLYGNLSKIFLKNGAIIKEHEPVGEAGESSTLGAVGLYFEIRYKGKPLDPQQWLKR